MAYALNDVVSKIGKANIEGNIVPNEWYIHLRNEKGKVQSNAILLLADLVYWYRPVPIYDINDGKLTGYGKKFKEDLLQRSYRELENKFGLSKNQIRDALIFLEEKGLVFREFRDIKVGCHLVNTVMYLGIDADAVIKITKTTEKKSNDPISNIALEEQPSLGDSIDSENNKPIEEVKTKQPQISKNLNPPSPATLKPSTKLKDWSLSFSSEEKDFLNYLLHIRPETGETIERNNATWWIKSFGIEKIKTALKVYWQQVDKAKKNPKLPMPKTIGAYVRTALNGEYQPDSETQESSTKPQAKQPINIENLAPKPIIEAISPTPSKKFKGGVGKFPGGYEKNPNTNTKTSTKTFSQSSKINDWSLTFSDIQKNFLSFLLNIKPAMGDPIPKEAATWWIKKFGVDKVKTALQVYWQQVDKAKSSLNVPLPTSIGAYVRTALNDGTRPCQESDRKNKAFAESFKKAKQWFDLTITEKYCRIEGTGKDWYYHLPETVFIESLTSFFESFCSEESKYPHAI